MAKRMVETFYSYPKRGSHWKMKSRSTTSLKAVIAAHKRLVHDDFTLAEIYMFGKLKAILRKQKNVITTEFFK